MLGTYITIASLILILIGVIIAWQPINYLLMSKLNAADYEMLMKITRTAVQWAEQFLATKGGIAKKTEVLNWLVSECEHCGLPFTEFEIDKAIEQAVYEMNKEK